MNSDQLAGALRAEGGEAAREAARRLDNITAYLSNRALLVSTIKVNPRYLTVGARYIIDLIDGEDVDPEEEPS